MSKYKDDQTLRIKKVPKEIVEEMYDGSVDFRLLCIDVGNLNEKNMDQFVTRHGENVDWDLTKEMIDEYGIEEKILFLKVYTSTTLSEEKE